MNQNFSILLFYNVIPVNVATRTIPDINNRKNQNYSST